MSEVNLEARGHTFTPVQEWEDLVLSISKKYLLQIEGSNLGPKAKGQLLNGSVDEAISNWHGTFVGKGRSPLTDEQIKKKVRGKLHATGGKFKRDEEAKAEECAGNNAIIMTNDKLVQANAYLSQRPDLIGTIFAASNELMFLGSLQEQFILPRGSNSVDKRIKREKHSLLLSSIERAVSMQAKLSVLLDSVNSEGSLPLGSLMPDDCQSDRTKLCIKKCAEYEEALEEDETQQLNENHRHWKHELAASDANDKLKFTMKHVGDVEECQALISTLRFVYNELNAKTPRQKQRIRCGINGRSVIDMMVKATETFKTLHFIVE